MPVDCKAGLLSFPLSEVDEDNVLVSENRKKLWYTNTHVRDKAGVAYIGV